MKRIDLKYIHEVLSDTKDRLGENMFKGYGDKSTLGLPNIGGGDVKVGDGNRFHMPSGKGQGSGQDKENQGTPSKPEYGNQENAKAASNAGPSNDTFSHEAKEDPESSEELSLKVAGDVDALPSMDMNKYEDPGTKENKRGKNMMKLKGGVKKLPNSVAEGENLMGRLSNAIALLEQHVAKDEEPHGEKEQEALDREEKEWDDELQKTVVSYNPENKTQEVLTLEQVQNKEHSENCDLYTYEKDGENIRLLEKIN